MPGPLQDFKHLQSDDRNTQKHLADDGEKEKQRKDKTGKGWGGEGRRVVKNKCTQVGQRKESEKAKEKGDSPLLHFAP